MTRYMPASKESRLLWPCKSIAPWALITRMMNAPGHVLRRTFSVLIWPLPLIVMTIYSAPLLYTVHTSLWRCRSHSVVSTHLTFSNRCVIAELIVLHEHSRTGRSCFLTYINCVGFAVPHGSRNVPCRLTRIVLPSRHDS
ncbi:hypothetical protein K491DRAFT_367678 [Lophiostoma macrostomum CBS 122681]|uniref:Uncharacterized protein n=1 Tax=Lophiostoma macrostomum CBS 122681 TaxID=1314788 RepID=A0A6A6TAN0_9PLEO|nr:hypothetical protein K491DRAFT_367678 [Lophiostoma macrostomum CBS 122681]